jgi:hypothetical protein
MSVFLTLVMAMAALLFVALSATVNALFLSSLGRTPMEVGLLAALSIAADVAKAGLPVVVVRALTVRAWGHLISAALMLALVIALSLASGIGFTALTRSTGTSARESKAEQVANLRKDLLEIDHHLQRLPETRAIAIVDTMLNGLRIDRRWAATKACTDITTAQGRLFCTDFMTLDVERVQSVERARLEKVRNSLRDKLAMHGDGAAAEIDPQSSAIGAVLGVDGATPRRALSVFLAIVIETGSVLLVFLTLGPALAGWQPPGGKPNSVPQPANIPQVSDVTRWQQSQGVAKVSSDWLGPHAR